MFEDIRNMTNKELAEIIEDFYKCGDCSNCKADMILCGFDNSDKIRTKFALEVAKRLKEM